MPGHRFDLLSLSAVVLVAAFMAGCSSPPAAEVANDNHDDTVLAVRTPAEREMAIATTGCGDAPATVGSGVVIEQGLVLTAAHVVAGAAQVWVRASSDLPTSRAWPEFRARSLTGDEAANGTVVAIDKERDLALITVPETLVGQAGSAGNEVWNEISTVDLDGAEQLTIHGIANPEPEPATVLERTRIIVDEVRGTRRVERLGYRIDAATTTGDSGAGVWHRHQLAGILFAVSADDSAESWAVAGSEIAALLAEYESEPSPQEYRCVPEHSELQPID